ncbi:MAG: ornithine--oxo-acid transaminase [Chlorobi bacterium]|nr:ornithine--oxo-acid transaminase [Chlorobiota bacterium]
MNTKEFIDIENEYGAHNYHPLDVVIKEAKGVWVTDVEGNKFMDCLAAYSAVNQGHCHPKIMEAFVEQAKHVTLTSRAFRNDQLPMLYKELHDLTGYEMALPMNSGAEAVETAVKTARKWGYKVKGIAKDKAEIIVASDNFHGRTTTIVSFSTDDQARADFGPYTPGFPVVEYGNIDALKAKINENTAAVMLEPIQGEAGIVVPPAGYLKEVEKICKDNNVLFICDEIQSGLGRSGKLFAHYYEGVNPDMVIIGKALSGGFYPVSAVLSSKAILGVFKPGEHGSTFGGNPLAAAVARKSLQVIIEEKLVEKSAENGDYFMNKLRAIDSPHITEVRGRGLWIGFVLNTKARPYCENLMSEGILCKETHENIIRFAPPLTITKEEIDWAVERIEKVVKALD